MPKTTPRTPTRPERTLAVRVVATESRFVPTYRDGAPTAEVRACIPPDATGKRSVTLTSRTMAVLDAGIALDLPEGWRAEVVPTREWSLKGLVLSDASARGRVSVVVGNIGKEILVIADGDVIGQLLPAPAYRFQFEEVG